MVCHLVISPELGVYNRHVNLYITLLLNSYNIKILYFLATLGWESYEPLLGPGSIVP